MHNPGRVAVFLSGRGSNFHALYRASQKPDSGYTIALVISDRKAAVGFLKALRLGIPAVHMTPRSFPDRDQFETELIGRLHEHRIDLICLAGYMRLVGPTLLAAYTGRIMNIHPALLPAFPGLHAQRQAIEYGGKVSGCTVHFVDGGMDTGPIILQRAVVIPEGDCEETLSSRILRWEHRLYPDAVRLYFQGRLQISGRRVIIKPQ